MKIIFKTMNDKIRLVVVAITIGVVVMVCCSCSNIENATEEDQAKFDKCLPDFEIINQVVQDDTKARGINYEAVSSDYEVDRANGVWSLLTQIHTKRFRFN